MINLSLSFLTHDGGIVAQTFLTHDGGIVAQSFLTLDVGIMAQTFRTHDDASSANGLVFSSIIVWTELSV
jgi:hypothetical protein